MVEGQVRATLNYNKQWTTLSNPFTTMSASFDMSLLENRLKKGWMGAGLLIMDHKAGAGYLTYQKLMLSLSYFQWLDNWNYLSFGVQTGLVQYKKDFNKLLSQSNGVPSYVNNDKTDKISKLDLQTGILWSLIPHENLKVYSGIGVFHILRPNNHFPDPDYTGATDLWTEDRIGIKTIIHSNAKISTYTRLELFPSVLYMRHKGKQEIMIGTSLGIKLGKNYNTKVMYVIGSWYQSDDAVNNKDIVVFKTGLQYHKWWFNIRYFVKTSFFEKTIINLLHPEFSLIYIIPAPPGPGEWPSDYPDFY